MAKRNTTRKPAPSKTPARILTRDLILGAEDCPREKVSVPEWGGHVYVRVMTGMERDLYDCEIVKNLDNDHVRARLLARTLCDENGVAIFGPDDIHALGAKSGVVLDRLFMLARDLNAMGDDVEKLEGLAKNLKTVLGGGARSS